MLPALGTPSVEPSGGALATAAMAVLPLAPGGVWVNHRWAVLGAVPHPHRPAGLRGDVGAEDARGEIGHAAGRGRDDDLDGFRRIAVGESGNGRDAGKGQDRQRANDVNKGL